MISVPNLRQPLNGSKWFLIFVAFSMLTSCELFRPVQTGAQQPVPEAAKPKPTDRELDAIQGRRVYDPSTGTYVTVENAPVEKMDTLRWTTVAINPDQIIKSSGDTYAGTSPTPPTRTTEIRTDERTNSKILSAYNVSIVLPFLTDRFSTTSGLPQNSDWALGFYGGVRLALEELERDNIKLNVSVIDDRASDTYTPQLLRTNADLRAAHLIIGPYRREVARQIADFAQTNDKTVISPYTTSDSVTMNNPNYIQVNPSLRTHCEALTRHARQRFRPEQIVLVARNREIDRFAFFQQENAVISNGRNVRRFREYVVPENAEVSSGQLLSLMQTDTTVFMVPSWSTEAFVNSFLRKLESAKRDNQAVIVYGMPQWMEYETIEYDVFERLNVHVSSSTFTDPLSPDVQFFKRRFFDRYGAVPRDEAYLGYDVTLFSGKMLKKYGTKFQYYLESEPTQVLHTRFDFERVVNIPATTANVENLPIQRFENKFVNILHFRDYQFKLAE